MLCVVSIASDAIILEESDENFHGRETFIAAYDSLHKDE